MPYYTQTDELPLISVVIPTNNRKHWLCEAIDSVLEQSYPNIELIVVDDGSSDGTSELIKNRYADRLLLLRTEGTSCGRAKNFGARHATGSLISFLDDDDLWYPEKLEKQLGLMQQHGESVGVVGAGCDYIDSNGRPTLKPTLPDSEEVTYEQCCIRVSLPGSGSNTLIRRALFEQLGRFDEQLARAEDRDLWIKIARDHRILLHPDILCSIRIHNTVRRGVDLDVIERCREIINQRIPEKKLRRLASGWTYFYLFQVAWGQSRLQAARYLLRSFWVLPYSNNLPSNRVKEAINLALNR